jgi:hypothetical protein
VAVPANAFLPFAHAFEFQGAHFDGGSQPGQQHLSVEITATLAHFLQGRTLATFGAGVTVISRRVIDGSHVVATLFVAPDAPLGPRTVMLTTGNELLTPDNGFTVRRLPVPTQPFVYRAASP